MSFKTLSRALRQAKAVKTNMEFKNDLLTVSRTYVPTNVYMYVCVYVCMIVTVTVHVFSAEGAHALTLAHHFIKIDF